MRLNGRRKPDMGKLTTPTLSDKGDVNKKDVSDGIARRTVERF